MQLKQINWLWHRSVSPRLGVLTRAEIDEQLLSYIQSGMAKSELSPEDVSDVVSELSSCIKSPETLRGGDLMRELSTKTTSDTSSGLSSDFAIPDCIDVI